MDALAVILPFYHPAGDALADQALRFPVGHHFLIY